MAHRAHAAQLRRWAITSTLLAFAVSVIAAALEFWAIVAIEAASLAVSLLFLGWIPRTTRFVWLATVVVLAQELLSSIAFVALGVTVVTRPRFDEFGIVRLAGVVVLSISVPLLLLALKDVVDVWVSMDTLLGVRVDNRLSAEGDSVLCTV